MEECVFKIYQKLGDYFTGTERRRVFYFCFWAALFGISWLSFYCGIVVSEHLLYQFFGNLIQALVTMVAFIGAFAIFRLEQRDKTLDRVPIAEKILYRDGSFFAADYLQKFAVYTFAIVLFFLACLVLAPYISEYYLGWPILVVSGYLTAYCLFLVVKGISNSI